MRECRDEIRQAETEVTALRNAMEKASPDFDRQIAKGRMEIAQLKGLISDVVLYMSKWAELTFSQLKMYEVEISLYDVVKTTGECKGDFKFTHGGWRYYMVVLLEIE